MHALIGLRAGTRFSGSVMFDGWALGDAPVGGYRDAAPVKCRCCPLWFPRGWQSVVALTGARLP